MIPSWNELDAFARTHLLGEHYASATTELRSAARAMAARDLCAALGCTELPDTPADWVTSAVGEQMLHLLSTRKQMLSGKGRVTAESVEGIGSCSYENPETSGVLCERARLFAELLLADCTKQDHAAVLRLNRG